MLNQRIFERFCEQSPVSVMARGLFEYMFRPGDLDRIFRDTAVQQREGELPFSLVVETLSLAVTSIRDSAHAAYVASKEKFSVSVNSFYNKLQGVETQVSRELVAHSAARLLPVVSELQGKRASVFKGYRKKIIDGNHLAASERRLKETRGGKAHSLPGFSIVVLAPDSRLILDVLPCEDAYAQERSLLQDVLPTVEAGDLWIADRAYCTTDFLFGIHQRKADFLIRQHATALSQKELVGRRRYRGKCLTGKVYEQELNICCGDKHMRLRRITIELDQPTSRGDKELHLVTTMQHAAVKLAELYAERWTIENAFQELGQSLHAEINTLCYPKAGLLAFCVASYTYNLISALKAAIEAAHPQEIKLNEISGYYLAEEISAICGGMAIALPATWWTTEFTDLTPREISRTLKQFAAKIDSSRFRKRIRKTRNPTAKRTGDYRGHVSAARILAARR